MKPDALVFVAALVLTSCSEPEESKIEYNKIEYNKGRQRAEVEGCHCNTALSKTVEAETNPQGKGWADGYVEACIRFRQERRC
ncbi:MAG: hypothetical protein L0Y38_12075 [Methylococcaceae bacterium]|nr:hypothetical protein [Methylococcaceae bacterium]